MKPLVLSRDALARWILTAAVLASGMAIMPAARADDATPAISLSPIGRQIADFTLQDYAGATYSLSDWPDKKAIVIVFLGTECPLAKLYASRLAKLAEKFAEQGVQFVGINSNRQDTLEEIGHWARAHSVEFPVLKDPGNQVADELAALRTPEAFLLDENRVVRYWGRIDDQFGVGYARGSATTAHLAIALEELLSGKPVSTPVTSPVGCFIGRVRPVERTGDITYTRHIAPILNAHCIRCHRAGEVAPFALTSYDEVTGWGETIAEVVRDRRMPPWHANPEHGEFANDARLPADAEQRIYAWVQNGQPEGDAADLPPPPEFVDGWQIGKPDIVYRMPTAYRVPARGVVPYQYFVLDETFDEDVWIRAAEMRPGNRAVTHHLILFYVPPGRKPRGDDALFNGIATFAPGMPPMELPEGVALRVPAGSRLAFQAHYTPNGREQTDLSEAGLVFADPSSVTREIKIGAALNVRFLIPPGAKNHRVEAEHHIAEDSLLHTLMPHMHYRGKSFRISARYPDGRDEILLDVPRYDFNWQNVYQRAEPKRLPQGTVVHMVAHYDNSAENLLNPDPTQPVRWGDQTWEEMMVGTMTLTPAEAKPPADSGDSDGTPSDEAR